MSNLHGHTSHYGVSTNLVERALVDLGGDAGIESIVRYVRKHRRATMHFSQRVQHPFMWRLGVLRALQQSPRCVQDNEGSAYWRLKGAQHPQPSVQETAQQMLKNVGKAFTARTR